MHRTTITDQEFSQFQKLIYDIAGISMSEAKVALVGGRLAKRLAHYGVDSYAEYFHILQNDRSQNELQTAVDLLTTNETYFFREQKHFDFLRDRILPLHRPNRPFRVWSAACSSGEEVYSIAMVIADVLGDSPWEVIGSDISTRMLQRAQSGHYKLERTNGISHQHLHDYCLKGIGTKYGTLLVNKNIRQRVHFRNINLNNTLPQIGDFDVIFLRNVMIYFSMETKCAVVNRILPLLRPGGHLFVSHSESLNGITNKLDIVMPSIYRKPNEPLRK